MLQAGSFIYGCFHVFLSFQVKLDPDMDSQLKIGFVGAGNMAFGITKGMLSGKFIGVFTYVFFLFFETYFEQNSLLSVVCTT